MSRPSRVLPALPLLLFPLLAAAQEPPSAPLCRMPEEEELAVEAFRRTGELPEFGEPPCLPEDPNRVRTTRHVTLYQEAADKVMEVYVAGGVATLLRLPSELAPRGTRIVGGGRRFDVLMGGKYILIVPTRQLILDERFAMEVVLDDGTFIALNLVRGQWPDGEVWLDKEQANPEQLRIRLASMKQKARGFEASLRQAQKEQESGDFALAGMMATGQSELTMFNRVNVRDLLTSRGQLFTLSAYSPRPDAKAMTNKVVAIIDMTNGGTEPLDLSSEWSVHDSDAMDVPFALRAQPTVILPGKKGRIAVVLDRASFGSDETLTLSFSDTLLVAGGFHLSVNLSLKDFAAPVETSTGWRWWRFCCATGSGRCSVLQSLPAA